MGEGCAESIAGLVFWCLGWEASAARTAVRIATARLLMVAQLLGIVFRCLAWEASSAKTAIRITTACLLTMACLVF